MANIKSAKKRIAQDRKKHLRNKAVKSQTRTAIKAYLKHRENDEQAALGLLNHAIKLIDKAASKNVFHRNKSSRLKSRLSKHYAVRFSADGLSVAQKTKPVAKEVSAPPTKETPAPNTAE